MPKKVPRYYRKQQKKILYYEMSDPFSQSASWRRAKRIWEDVPCYYCGDPARSVDHVIPRSMLNSLRVLDDKSVWKTLYSDHRIRLVSCCLQCNSILSNKYFTTLKQKKAHLKECLRKRYKKILEIPHWEEGEVKELSYRLGKYVTHSLSKKDWVLSRLAW